MKAMSAIKLNSHEVLLENINGVMKASASVRKEATTIEPIVGAKMDRQIAAKMADNRVTRGFKDLAMSEKDVIKEGRLSQAEIAQAGADKRATIKAAMEAKKTNMTGLKTVRDDLTSNGRTMTDDEAKLLGQTRASAMKELGGLKVMQAKAMGEQGLAHAKRFAQWHTEGTGMDMALKTGVTAGAWFGGNAALRGLSGGGMTYNNQGERDIAGIPFV